MSKQEKNLTKAEKVVLGKLNVKAALILQVEEIFSEAKIPMDVSLLYDMTEDDLLGLIETWAPENVEARRAKMTKRED
tara:strand:+ start:610 stop:843 length:234 start_codon:yes stop_codon:yes gene_type:complete